MLIFLVWLSQKDIRYRRLPVWIFWTAGIWGSLLAGIEILRSMMSLKIYPDSCLGEWIGGIGVGAICLLLAVFSRGGFGAGDGWAFLVTGIYLGFWDNVRLLMMALLFAFFFALICLLKKKCGRKQELPLIPFLLGAYLWLLAGG